MYVSYMGELTVLIVFLTVAIRMYRSSPTVLCRVKAGAVLVLVLCLQLVIGNFHGNYSVS